MHFLLLSWDRHAPTYLYYYHYYNNNNNN
jgi:hypothetical protein